MHIQLDDLSANNKFVIIEGKPRIALNLTQDTASLAFYICFDETSLVVFLRKQSLKSAAMHFVRNTLLC
jgi:hypothetical protein